MGDLVVAQPQGLLVATDEQVQVLKRTLAGGKLTDDEFGLFLEVARRSGLDPFKRQIHAVKRNCKENGEWIARMTIQTGIDGYRAIAMRHGLAGQEEAEHTYHPDDKNHRWPLTSRVVVYKRGPSGERDAYVGVARWHEYADLKDVDGKPQPQGQWRIRPHVMLDKCAEALALRKGFSEGLGGIYVEEEMSRDESVRAPTGRERVRSLDSVIDASIRQSRAIEPEDEDQTPPVGPGRDEDAP